MNPSLGYLPETVLRFFSLINPPLVARREINSYSEEYLERKEYLLVIVIDRVKKESSAR